MARVSVIIPVYSVENYIERCARSLFEQTLDDIEFIFIDDCTPDNSMGILSSVIEEYKPQISERHWAIRIERMPINSGQAAVRKYGLEVAQGDYIIFCDSDDYIEKSMLFDMYSMAKEKHLDTIVCDFYFYKEENVEYRKGVKSLTTGALFHEVLKDESSCVLWNKMFRRALFQEPDFSFPANGMNMAEDFAIVLQLLYISKTFGYVNKPLYHYCFNSSSISKRKSPKAILNNTVSWASNILLVESFLKTKNVVDKYCDELTKWKFLSKMYLLPVLYDSNCYELWKSLFPEINNCLYKNTFIPIKPKLLYFLTYIGLFKIIVDIFHKLK